jgi:hypothetical protein
VPCSRWDFLVPHLRSVLAPPIESEKGARRESKSEISLVFFLSEELNSLLIRGRDMVLSSIPAN